VTESPLFIRLYLDEDVSVFVAQLLRPHGFEVLTARDAQNLARIIHEGSSRKRADAKRNGHSEA